MNYGTDSPADQRPHTRPPESASPPAGPDSPSNPQPTGPPAPKHRFKLISRSAVKRLGLLALILALFLLWAWSAMIRMPGRSFTGPRPDLNESQRAAADRLRTDNLVLASEIGQRSTFYPRQLAQSALYLKQSLQQLGYEPRDHSFAERGSPTPNIDIAIPGTTLPTEIVIVGAHYDTYQGTPGADDNGSGVAATLELARRFANKPQARTLRFALFVNEEPPAFQTADMGSWIYAKKCKADGDNITAMLSLETMGFYNAEPGSQNYPPPLSWFYPDRGDFLAFVGNVGSRSLVKRSIATFREHAKLPSEGAALPEGLPGIGWSDHWAFWQEGYPGIMITDTAPFRNPHYHLASDKPDTLDYNALALAIDGLEAVILDLCNK